MNDKFEDIREKWRQQETNLKEIDMAELVIKNDDFTKKINSRNSLEWAAVIAVVPFFIYRMIVAETYLSRILSMELAIAGLYIAFHLYYQGRVEKQPDMSVSSIDFLNFQKRQVQRQIDLLSKARYWYVAPIMFGLVGLTLEKIYLKWNVDNLPWGSIAYLIGLILFSLYLIWLNEVKAVEKLKQQLKDLG